MLKNNNKGFVLVETLVVAVFVAAIFSVIYANFYPLMGEYEKREVYDDVDSKYATFWFKRIIQSGSVATTDARSAIANNKYYEFTCSVIDSADATAVKVCNNLVTRFGVEKMYITSYAIGDYEGTSTTFQTVVAGNGDNHFTSGFQDYIAYLPTYSKTVSLNNAKCRLIMIFHNTRNDNDYRTYANIELNKEGWCD